MHVGARLAAGKSSNSHGTERGIKDFGFLSKKLLDTPFCRIFLQWPCSYPAAPLQGRCRRIPEITFQLQPFAVLLVTDFGK